MCVLATPLTILLLVLLQEQILHFMNLIDELLERITFKLNEKSNSLEYKTEFPRLSEILEY